MRRYLPLVLTMVFWASAFTCSKLAIGAVSPEVAAFLRFGTGGLVLLVLCSFTARPGWRSAAPRTNPVPDGEFASSLTGRGTRFGWRGFSLVGLLGLLGVFGYNMLFFQGLVFAPATDGVVIVPVIAPVVTTVVAAVLERALPAPRRLVGLGIAIAGAAVFFAGIPAASGPDRPLGDLVFVAAAVPWAAYTLLGRTVLRRYPPLPVTTYATLAGGLLLGLVALPGLVQVHWAALGTGFWLDMAYLAMFPTVVAYPLYYRGVRQVGPAKAATMMFLVPVAGLVIAFVLLHETIGLVQGVGAVAMLAGAWLATVERSGGGQRGAVRPQPLAGQGDEADPEHRVEELEQR